LRNQRLRPEDAESGGADEIRLGNSADIKTRGTDFAS
jgi:hypothetical protein